MARILTLLFISISSYAAAITSAQAGPWSSTSTWTGGVIPGNGDTVTCTHDIGITDNRTVGTSPAAGGTAAIQINNGCKLTFSTAGVELTVRGDIKYAAPSVARNVIDATVAATITMDPTQSAAPTTTIYVIGPSATNTANATIKLYGTANSNGNRFVVRTLRTNGNEAQANFGLNGFTTQLNAVDAQYFELRDMGDVTNNAYTAYTPAMFRWRDGIFTRCGLISSGTTSLSATMIYDVQRTTFISSTGKNLYGTTVVARTSGTRDVKSNYFDAPYTTGSGWLDFTFDSNIFASSPGSFWAGVTTLINNNFIVHAGSSTISCNGGTISNNFFYNSNGATNGKMCQVNLTASSATFTDNTVEMANSGAGDLFTDIRSVGSGTTTTMTGTLALPRNDTTFPTAPGGWMQGSVANGVNWVVENITSVAGPANTNTTTSGACASSAAICGETTTCRANAITSYKGVLHWNIAGTTQGQHGCTQVAVVTDNILSATNAAYNSYWGCVATTLWAGKDNNNTCYWFPMTGGTVPGLTDNNTSQPYFPQPTRNTILYATERGFSPADYTGILAYLADITIDREAEIKRMHNWIRMGHEPQNVDMAHPSAPRGYRGAIKPTLLFGQL